MAMVKLSLDGQQRMKTCEGDGPVDAAFTAVNTITKRDFKLADFSLHAVTEGEDALGEAVIKLQLGDKTVLGRGVSTDIIEASLMGYINAVNKLLF
jgi:2-isopropylmalate synthase